MGRNFGEAAVPEGECGPRLSLHYILAFALQVRRNHGKPSVMVAEKYLADQYRARFV
jgi:hypothetical protein